MSLFIKICGITGYEDGMLASSIGADAVGFVFVPESSRFIALERAAELSGRLPASLQRVGVFRDQPLEEVLETAALTGLDAVQLHGSEGADACRAVMDAGFLLYKSVNVGCRDDLAKAAALPADAYLLDSGMPGNGGSGHAFDWGLADECTSFSRIILAGGLNESNVAEAVRLFHPYGVDVSTGVESGPGRKDHMRMRAFVTAARNAHEGKEEQHAEA